MKTAEASWKTEKVFWPVVIKVVQNKNLQFVIQAIHKNQRKKRGFCRICCTYKLLRETHNVAIAMNLKLNLTPDIYYEIIRITIT